MSHETVDGEEEARVMRSRRIARREGHLPFVPFGLVPLAYGLWVLDPVATILGASISIAGKMLFMGEMVALYDRMKAAHPQLAYRAGA